MIIHNSEQVLMVRNKQAIIIVDAIASSCLHGQVNSFWMQQSSVTGKKVATLQ